MAQRQEINQPYIDNLNREYFHGCLGAISHEGGKVLVIWRMYQELDNPQNLSREHLHSSNCSVNFQEI
eukprot:scaffold164441_cov18-Tisochrysis_lutea.AAC.2